jgi:hypothetical protein
MGDFFDLISDMDSAGSYLVSLRSLRIRYEHVLTTSPGERAERPHVKGRLYFNMGKIRVVALRSLAFARYGTDRGPRYTDRRGAFPGIP